MGTAGAIIGVLFLFIIIGMIAAGIFLYMNYFNLKDNSECVHNSQCDSGACGYPAAGADKHICCPSKKVNTYAANDYCTEMPNGTACWSDAMCANGVCIGNLGGVKTGVCGGKAPINTPCKHDNQCANGACGWPSFGASQQICCPSGDLDRHVWANDYCTQMPSGTKCLTDAMCASKLCKGSIAAIGKSGVCT